MNADELRARFEQLFLETEPDYAVVKSLLDKVYPPEQKAAEKPAAKATASR